MFGLNLRRAADRKVAAPPAGGADPVPPAGELFLVDGDGAILVDGDGAFMTEAA